MKIQLLKFAACLLLTTVLHLPLQSITAHQTVNPTVLNNAQNPFGWQRPRPLNLDELRHSLPYPQQCRKEGIEGRAVLKLKVNVRGQVESMELIEATHLEFAAVCKRHFAALKFLPATNTYGHAIPAWIKIPVRFELK